MYVRTVGVAEALALREQNAFHLSPVVTCISAQQIITGEYLSDRVSE